MYDNDSLIFDYEKWSYSLLKQCAYNRKYMSYEVCLCLLGMINTAFYTFVFTRPLMKKSFMNTFLLALETSNFVSMAVHMIHIAIVIYCPAVSPGTTKSAILELVLSLHLLPICFVIMIIPFIGVWRFIALAWPIRARVHLTRRLAVKITVGVIITSTVYYLYIYLYHSLEHSLYTEYESDTSTCYVLPSFTKLVKDFRSIQCGLFERQVFLSIGVLLKAVTCVLYIIVNLVVICGLMIKKYRQSRLQEGQKIPLFSLETQVVCGLILVMLAHVTCYFGPDLVTVIVYMCSKCQIHFELISCFFFRHFPAVIYMSFLNFFCYCLLSKHFRITVWTILKLDFISKIISRRMEKQLVRKSATCNETTKV